MYRYGYWERNACGPDGVPKPSTEEEYSWFSETVTIWMPFGMISNWRQKSAIWIIIRRSLPTDGWFVSITQKPGMIMRDEFSDKYSAIREMCNIFVRKRLIMSRMMKNIPKMSEWEAYSPEADNNFMKKKLFSRI